MKQTYLAPDQSAAAAFFSKGITHSVVMLNLLRFRDVADYSSCPELAPKAPISGREAYDRYMAHTKPLLEKSGGGLMLLGEGGRFFIGPQDERWDQILLVRQASPQSFMAFASDPAYQAGMGHRTAALEDSRLLPIIPSPEFR